MEESSTIKRNSKSSGKKVKKIEDSNDGGKLFDLQSTFRQDFCFNRNITIGKK